MNRIQFAEKYFVLRNKPFSLKDYDYLRPIYLDSTRNRRILLKTGRQVAKTQTLCNLMLIDCFTIPNFNAIYVTFTLKQMLAFAHQKLDPILAESKALSNIYLTGQFIRNSIQTKRFANNSTIFLRHTYLSANTTRGLSADRICIDEIQLMLTDNIPVIEECASFSKYKWIIYCGTPLSEDSSLEDLWNISTKNEWLLRCPHCEYYNYQDMEIITEEGLLCRKCRKIMPREQITGKWFVTNRDAKIIGYRFTQLPVKWIPYSEIIYKLKNYSPQLFHNEVLALPYSISDQVINIDELTRAMKLETGPPESYTHYNLIAGIDWGTGNDSFTALAIGYFDSGKTYIIYCKKFIGAEADPLKQIDILYEICAKYKVKLVLADYGLGFTSNPLLAQKLNQVGILLFPVMYTSQNEIITWSQTGQRYVVDRTRTLANLFSSLKNDRLFLPKMPPELYKDFLHIREQIRQVSGSDILFYDHRKSEPDDLVHAVNYVNIGCILLNRYV